MTLLRIFHGASPVREVQLQRPLATLGRSDSNDIVIAAAHLSSEHGQFVQEADAVYYCDLRSTNGSAVMRGGVRTAIAAGCNWRWQLAPGDKLILGDANTPVTIDVIEVHDRAASLGLRAREESLTPITAPVPTTTPIELDEDDDDDAVSSRLIAARSIVDLDAVSRNQPASVIAIYKAAQRLSTRLVPSAVLQACAEAVFEVLPQATNVAILLRDETDRDRFSLATAKVRRTLLAPIVDSTDGVRASRAVLRRALAQRAGLLLSNAPEELSASESILGGKIMSILAVPLWRGNEITGLIQADNRHAAGIFTEDELDRLLLLGSLGSLAIDNAILFGQVRQAEEKARGENQYLRRREPSVKFDKIIGTSSAMRTVFAQLEKVIDTRATVCIEGETGTGKELVASAIHQQSQRAAKLFVAQNCAALPETLLESELFGHRRGAFTGADADKKGLFEIADGGTLFLDEIGEMPLTLQAKLLRVLQEGSIRPVGATSERHVDVRIICATNRDLAAEVAAGRFRQDLYYRLAVFPIALPPLRDRKEDIPALARHFLRRYAEEYRIDLTDFSQEALDALMAYAWPGNIRELENEVQRLVIAADSGHPVEVTDLSPRLRKIEGTVARIAPKPGTLKEMMDQVERWLIAEALRDHGGNKTKTAVALGITREGLHKKLAKLDI